MTIGVLKSKTLVALVKEVTEGTPVDPTVGTEFIQALDGISNDPAKELVERAVLTPLKGKIQPRVSTKSSSGSLPLEWKSSGTEGADDLEAGEAYESLLGGKRQITARDAVEVGSTTTDFVVTAHGLSVGDFLHILEPGAHHLAFVKSITDADNFVITPAMPSAPTIGTEYAKSTVYYASDNEPTITETIYWGDEIKEQIAGVRMASAAFENIVTGQTPTVTFATQGLNFTEVDGSAPVTPSYNNVLPPIALAAMIGYDGVCLEMDEASFSVENTIANLTSLCSDTGIVASRIASRAVSGSITPYLDDTSVANFTKFDNNTNFELVIAMANPSSVAGEYDLGSAIGAYMPKCIFTALPKADKDGVITQAGEFQSHTGADGSTTEIFLGFA